MKSKGITLAELIITLVIGAFIFFVLFCQAVAEQRFRMTVIDQTAAVNEASVATHYMARVLRFAYPDTTENPITISTDSTYSKKVTATIMGGCLPEMSSDTVVTFGRVLADNTITYTVGGGAATVIARNIVNETDFDVIWYSDTKELILKVASTFTRPNWANYGRTLALETALRVLGQEA